MELKETSHSLQYDSVIKLHFRFARERSSGHRTLYVRAMAYTGLKAMRNMLTCEPACHGRAEAAKAERLTVTF